MNSELTDITLVIDRSGSMAARRDDAEGGVNTFIKEQAGQPGDAFLSLVQFDTEYEVVHDGVPIDNVPDYELHPRGATALLDAVGRAITTTRDRLNALDENERAKLVVFVIVTDGMENASQEFNKPLIKEMIERQQEQGWQFTFLGANQDAFAEAGGLGIRGVGVAQFSNDRYHAAYSSSSARIARMRRAARAGDQFSEVGFTSQELLDMDSSQQRGSKPDTES